MTVRRIIAFLAAVFLPLLFSACASSEPELEPVTLQLNWSHEAEFVGYYVAKDMGFYEEQGLDVTVVEGGSGKPARLTVLDGSADFAISSFAEQQQFLEDDQPVVAVGSVFQIPPLAGC